MTEAARPEELLDPTNPVVIPRGAVLVDRVLVPFGFAATAVALGMVVVLHLLPGWGGVNPITGMLSDYGVRSDGWVFDTALDVLSLGSAALLVDLARRGLLRGRLVIGLMVAWCVCLVGIASFTKDPNLGADTLRGAIHLYSTAAACFSLPVGCWLLGRRYRNDLRWRHYSRIVRWVAWISVPCFLPFVISFFVIRMTHSSGVSVVPTGLVERLMGGLDIGLLVVLGVWSQHAARVGRGELDAIDALDPLDAAA
jgi:hypothetical protein